MNPVIYKIEPTYKKENGLWVLDIDAISLPKNFKTVERNIVYIPPNQYGGNHKHPRSEIFIAIGEKIKLTWLTADAVKKEVQMNDLTLFHIPSNLPHAVINESNNQFGLLIEFADAKQHKVTPIDVI